MLALRCDRGTAILTETSRVGEQHATLRRGHFGRAARETGLREWMGEEEEEEDDSVARGGLSLSRAVAEWKKFLTAPI